MEGAGPSRGRVTGKPEVSFPIPDDPLMRTTGQSHTLFVTENEHTNTLTRYLGCGGSKPLQPK